MVLLIFLCVGRTFVCKKKFKQPNVVFDFRHKLWYQLEHLLNYFLRKYSLVYLKIELSIKYGFSILFNKTVKFSIITQHVWFTSYFLLLGFVIAFILWIFVSPFMMHFVIFFQVACVSLLYSGFDQSGVMK